MNSITRVLLVRHGWPPSDHATGLPGYLAVANPLVHGRSASTAAAGRFSRWDSSVTASARSHTAAHATLIASTVASSGAPEDPVPARAYELAPDSATSSPATRLGTASRAWPRADDRSVSGSRSSRAADDSASPSTGSHAARYELPTHQRPSR